MFSMGQFCIDEVHYAAAGRSYTNVIGGAGTFAALGAGLHLRVRERGEAQFVLDKGRDFTPEMEAKIRAWRLGVVWRTNADRDTTRTCNTFVENEERLFKYLSPKKQINPDDVPPASRAAPAFHLVCSPLRCREFLQTMQSRVYVYEPVPTSCLPEEYENLKLAVATGVTVLSPNALEAARFVGLPEPRTRTEVEELCAHFTFAPVLLIRCGAMGSFLRAPGRQTWYAPFHRDAAAVVDPTGAGNAFCGGLAVALGKNYDWDTAMAFANVSASYMIEQVGPPTYDEDADTWNGDSPDDRVDAYARDNQLSI